MAYTRMTININSETDAALRELSQRDETSITETVRRAIGVYKFICDEVQKGKRLKLVGDDEVISLALVT